MFRPFTYPILLSLMLVQASVSTVAGQVADTLTQLDEIAVLARPWGDSITIRWAPVTLKVWQSGNAHGYRIERYTIMKDGHMLREPYKILLTSQLLKPWPESEWESAVHRNNFAAIAAQALYGDAFHVDLSNSDAFTIVNKVEENLQRYTFALFCADMSKEVAKASGLLFTDQQTTRGEKYLYRLFVGTETDHKGSIFAGADEPYELPVAQNVRCKANGSQVSIEWTKPASEIYTAYMVEKSTNGTNFIPVSDSPVITVSPSISKDTRREYAVDSLDIGVTKVFYRVRGLTPFGETGPHSPVSVIEIKPMVKNVPYISSSENIDNKSILLKWEFESESNAAIKGFSLERSERSSGNFSMISRGELSPETRQYEDVNPGQVNYYKVTAYGIDGSVYRSPVFLAQLIDSIPPSAPTGLRATIDDFGNVSVAWNPNPDPDIFGYRVYRSNTPSEEMIQITYKPVDTDSVTDNVNLNTLTESVFYSVMAIDRNQNHSALSRNLEVPLPDKVKPMPPALLPFSSDSSGVSLNWLKSSSEDVVHYDVYRKSPGQNQWQRIKIIDASEDSTFHSVDETGMPGDLNLYTVIAVDDAGLESTPATSISAARIAKTVREPLTMNAPVVSRENHQVLLTWGRPRGSVRVFRIYRSADGSPPILHKTLNGETFQYTDKLLPGRTYKFFLLAEFTDGSRSALSDAIMIEH